jgi:hypothetical protein
VQTDSGDQPASCPVGAGAGALSMGVKWPEREADHSPSSSAEVKISGSICSFPDTSSWLTV